MEYRKIKTKIKHEGSCTLDELTKRIERNVDKLDFLETGDVYESLRDDFIKSGYPYPDDFIRQTLEKQGGLFYDNAGNVCRTQRGEDSYRRSPIFWGDIEQVPIFYQIEALNRDVPDFGTSYEHNVRVIAIPDKKVVSSYSSTQELQTLLRNANAEDLIDFRDDNKSQYVAVYSQLGCRNDVKRLMERFREIF